MRRNLSPGRLDRVRSMLERRCCDDGGAVIVEAALVIPLLVVILAGTFDFSVGYRNRITMQGAARNTARAAAVLGPDVTADKFALSTLNAGIQSLDSAVINKVVIFQTTSAGAISSTCQAKVPSASGNGDTTAGAKCNVYGLTQMNSLGTFVQAGAGCTTGWDRFWCPSQRKNQLTDPPDYLGVYLEVTYTPFTKIFKSTFTLTDKVVVRIEPAAA